MYGQTRLADYYTGHLSLRELANRFWSLPAEAPIWDIMRAEEEQAEAARKDAEHDDVLNRYRR